jgi:formamidopyrimidine-DNA glycosylase
MPEGPEVRRYADRLAAVLEGERIIELAARTRDAKAWLLEHPNALPGRRIESIRTHGKHLIGTIEGGYYFHSHLMMWGRWEIVPKDGSEWKPDRRERAHITVKENIAVLLSAPIFEVGQGDPYEHIPLLTSLGPDIIPHKGEFDGAEWRRRLLKSENRDREIGAALLDQRICSGIGNYLRAEILFACQLDPWRRVGDLTAENLACLQHEIAAIGAYAYAHSGATAPDEARDRMRTEDDLVYAPGRDWGTRHWVFRRTNLPCLKCGDIVRQMRQITYVRGDDETVPQNARAEQIAPLGSGIDETIELGEEADGNSKDGASQSDKTRIIYFCPTCQNPSIELPPRRAGKKVKTIGSVKSKSDTAMHSTVQTIATTGSPSNEPTISQKPQRITTKKVEGRAKSKTS